MPEDTSKNKAFGWPSGTVRAILAFVLVGAVVVIAVAVIYFVATDRMEVVKTMLPLVFTPVVLMADRVVRDYFQKGKEEQ